MSITTSLYGREREEKPEPTHFQVFHDLLHDKELSATDLHIGLFLEAKAGSNICDEHGNRMARYGTAELAGLARCSDRSVRRAFSALADRKYVVDRKGNDLLLRQNPTPVAGSREVLYTRCPKSLLTCRGLDTWQKHLLLHFLSQGRAGMSVNVSHRQALAQCSIPGHGDEARTRKLRKFIAVMSERGIMTQVEEATVRRPATFLIDLARLPTDSGTPRPVSGTPRGRGGSGGQRNPQAGQRNPQGGDLRTWPGPGQRNPQGRTAEPPRSDSGTPRNADSGTLLLSSSSSSALSLTPSDATQPKAKATELQLAGRCATGGGGLRPRARDVELNREASPQPCREDSHNPDFCEAEGPQPQSRQEGHRPALLAAFGGSAGPTPAPVAEAQDEAKEAPRYDLAKMRAALRKNYGADLTPQPAAAPPAAKRQSERDRYRVAVEEVETLSILSLTAQKTEMGLGRVARFLHANARDLPAGWATADLHAAFASSEFYGADRLSWGWVISEAVWPRFATMVKAAYASRKVREADRAESIAKAELAANSDDPTQRAKAGAYYLLTSVARPLEGITLLLEALGYAESANYAARALQEWASSPTGGEALFTLAVRKLGEFLDGRDAEGSDAADYARWALRTLQFRLAYPPVEPTYDDHGELVLAVPGVSELLAGLADD